MKPAVYDRQHEVPRHIRESSPSCRRIVSELGSAMCSVRASTASSYSNLLTTRCATYSKTSATPSPVLADVKNSFAPRSGGGDMGSECVGAGDGVAARVLPLERPYKLGVIVWVSESADEKDGCRRAVRTGDALGERERDGVEMRE